MGKGGFEAANRPDLGGPEAGAGERRQVVEAGAERRSRGPGFFRQPVGEGFGAVEGEYGTAAGVGLEQVGEPGLDAGALIAEGKRAAVDRQALGEALAILERLLLETGKGAAFLLGLNDAAAAPST